MPIPDSNLDLLVSRFLNAGDPLKIVLFGSRSRGDSRPDSDYDLLVIERSEQPRHARSRVYYRAINDLPIETDILVYTPEEADDWRAVPQALVTSALSEGRTLYEKQS